MGRNADRVRALSKICGAEALGKDQLNGRHFDVVVHATPLGMFPHVNESFFSGSIEYDGRHGFAEKFPRICHAAVR